MKIKEAIEENRYTIWPSNRSTKIEKFVVHINPIFEQVDLTTYYDPDVTVYSSGDVETVNPHKVLNKEELHALQLQINRLQSICRSMYAKKANN